MNDNGNGTQSFGSVDPRLGYASRKEPRRKSRPFEGSWSRVAATQKMPIRATVTSYNEATMEMVDEIEEILRKKEKEA